MKISELIATSYAEAIAKGWHAEPRSFGDLIALCHSELSEALEEFRSGRKPYETWYRDCDRPYDNPQPAKPEGVPIELADVVIRIADMCGRYGIDLEEAIRIKLAYNKTRSQRHGGKVL